MQRERAVYFGAAIRGDRVVADTVCELIRFIRDDLGFPVLNEHVGTADPIAAFAAKVGKTKETLTAPDIERQDTAWLDEATHMICEISGASTGTGREVEYARTKGLLGKVPTVVLVLYDLEREFQASPMVRGMTPERYPNVCVRYYTDAAHAKQLIREFLHEAP